MFETMAANNDLFKASDSDTKKVPKITGFIYINNNTEVEELYIRNQLQPKYPDLKFFFNKDNVKSAYTANFILIEEDPTEDGSLNYTNSKYKLIGS